MNEITKSLYKLAEDKGVKFFFNSDVSEIIIKDDVAKGIKSFKKGMASDAIETDTTKNVSENQDTNNQDTNKD